MADMTTNEDERYMTASAAAIACGLSPKRLQKLARIGCVPFKRKGHFTMISTRLFPALERLADVRYTKAMRQLKINEIGRAHV